MGTALVALPKRGRRRSSSSTRSAREESGGSSAAPACPATASFTKVPRPTVASTIPVRDSSS
jgi:hypothetical protein